MESCNLVSPNYCSNDDNDEDEGNAVDMDAFVESGILEDDSVIYFIFNETLIHKRPVENLSD